MRKILLGLPVLVLIAMLLLWLAGGQDVYALYRATTLTIEDAYRFTLGQAPPPHVPATIQERAWSSPIWIRAAQKKHVIDF